MLIGLMSDTHDCLPLIRAAVKELNDRGARLVLHAGDFVAPFVVRELHRLNAPCIGVFGNNDGDHELLKKKMAEKEGFALGGSFATITFQNRSLAILHGHEPDLVDALIGGNTFDLIVHGHSHQRGIRQKGRTLVVNPGEVCGYLTGISTIALYDADTGEAMLIELEG
ncbi:MAG: metallophosphoesterase [Methanomicrobiales archaeon]|nr:metallophosphoesterase [Methanomicrobiales archaeon]